MLGRQERRQQTLFFTCQLGELVPDDHILKRIDRVLDLSWLAAEVGPLYAAGHGRPSIDPEVAVRLMLAGFFEGIVHDRKLLRQAEVNVAIRWFCGYGLDEALPDHSSLTRIRQRWGAARFRRIFERTVQACVGAGLVSGETVHVDATLIRADVSWESLVARHVEQSVQVNEVADETTSGGETALGGQDEAAGPSAPRPRVSRTDPDARVAKGGRARRGEPAYKQMTAVDDAAGIIVDVAIEPGTRPEGAQLVSQLERVASTTGRAPRRVTADKAYASAANYAALEARGIEAIIAPERVGRAQGALPGRRFKYDARHDVVRCPGGRVLTHRSFDGERHHYRAEAAECRRCRLRAACLAPSATARTVRLLPGHSALVRARRRCARGGPRSRGDQTWRRQMARHRWQVEGVHGEAKSQHGLARAARRRLWNVSIQAYLTAVAINLKRLARAACGPPARAACRRVRSVARRLFGLLVQGRRRLCPA